MNAQTQSSHGLFSLSTLPVEILLLITKRLKLGAVSKLAASCQRLQQRLEFELYQRPHSAEKALVWAASHGVVATIHRAVEHGASVSAVPGPDERTRSTLWLAAKNNHLDAVQCLLELGAVMNTPTTRQRDYHCFLKWLCWRCQTDTPLLETFLTSQAGRQVIKNDMTSADICLYIKLLHKWPSIDVIRLILKFGASPRKLQLAGHDLDSPQAVDTTTPSGKLIVCPLVCAVERCNAPLFDILVEHGASIHGNSGTSISHYRECVPIYAYAGLRLDPPLEAVGRRERKRAWMLKCLEAGAEISHPGHQHRPDFTSEDHPLLFYDEMCAHYDEHCWMSCNVSAPCRFLCPLTMYLANLGLGFREYPDEEIAKLLSEIKFYIDHGAQMSRSSVPNSQQWHGRRHGPFYHRLDPIVPLPPEPRADNPIIYKFLLHCRGRNPDTPPLVYTILHYLWDRQPLTDIAIAKRLLCEHDYCTHGDRAWGDPPEAQHSFFIRRVINTFWRYHPAEGEEKGVQGHAARDREFIEMLRARDMVEYQIDGGMTDFT